MNDSELRMIDGHLEDIYLMLKSISGLREDLFCFGNQLTKALEMICDRLEPISEVHQVALNKDEEREYE